MMFVYIKPMRIWSRIRIYLFGGRAEVTISEGWEPTFASEFNTDTDNLEWVDIIFERRQWPPKGPKFMWRMFTDG